MDRNVLRTDILVANRLKTYSLTDSLIQLEEEVKKFCKIEDLAPKPFNFSSEELNIDSKKNETEESEDYLQILKLRHVNIVK